MTYLWFFDLAYCVDGRHTRTHALVARLGDHSQNLIKFYAYLLRFDYDVDPEALFKNERSLRYGN